MIHTCPTCKNGYTGSACSPCFLRATTAERTRYLREMNKVKVIDNTIAEFDALFNDDTVYQGKLVADQDIHQPLIQDQDLSQPQDQEKPTLKLYKLYIREPLRKGQPGGKAKTAIMYVLGKSEPSTVESVRAWLQNELGDWSFHVQVVSIKELTGPFDHGHVIHYSETSK